MDFEWNAPDRNPLDPITPGGIRWGPTVAALTLYRYKSADKR